MLKTNDELDALPLDSFYRYKAALCTIEAEKWRRAHVAARLESRFGDAILALQEGARLESIRFKSLKLADSYAANRTSEGN